MKKIFFLLVTILGNFVCYGITPQPDNTPVDFPAGAPEAPPPPPPLPINEDLRWLLFGALLLIFFYFFKERKIKSI